MQKKYEYKDSVGDLWFIEKQIEQKQASKGKIIVYTATKFDNSDKLTASRKSVLKQMLFEKVGIFEKEKNKCKLSIEVTFSIVQLRNAHRKKFNLQPKSRVSKKQIELWVASLINIEMEINQKG